MQNATLSIVALLLVLTFALNHRVVNSASDTAMERGEVELLAVDLANEVFGYIATLAFDASPDFLTPREYFGAAASWDDAVAIEELHGQTARIRTYGRSSTLDFEVTVAVDYVELDSEEVVVSMVPTFDKRVGLTLVGPNGFQARQERVYRP